MTKEEALIYIKKHAEPYSLTWECIVSFHQDCKSEEKHACGQLDDYTKLANDALYEWDI